MKATCQTCRFQPTCTNRKKGSGFWCDSHEPDPFVQMSLLGLSKKEKKYKTFLDEKYEELDANRFSLLDSVNEALDSNKLVPSDLRIPEKDFKEAPNFAEFCLNDSFLGVKPFAVQLEIATKLFAEWCPHCTDVDYFCNGGLQVNDSVKKFRSKVALLEHGVCPHCGARKSELISEGELNFYEELACSVGQRGGKSAMTAMMYAYIVHRVIKAQRLVDIYGLLNNTTLVITFTALTLSQVKIALWDPFHIYVSESPWFCLAAGTEITLAGNSTKLIELITVGDKVKTLEGQSEVTNVFDNGIQECYEIEFDSGDPLVGTESHQIRCLSDDGLSIVWKSIKDIKEGDFVLSE